MTTAIERAAKAIAGESFWAQMPEAGRNEIREEARAALATTREPTEAMHRAAKAKREADKAKGLTTPWGDVWRAMHDAMMAEGKEQPAK